MAESKKKLSIKVNIADRPYPLKIEPEEEESIRKAAKIINDKVRELQLKYDGKDKQDFLAMCLLQYAADRVSPPEADPPLADNNEAMLQHVNGFSISNKKRLLLSNYSNFACRSRENGNPVSLDLFSTGFPLAWE